MHSTFKAFAKSFAGKLDARVKLIGKLEASTASLASDVLFAGVFLASQQPAKSPADIAGQVVNLAGEAHAATLKNYESQLAGALRYARAKSIVPVYTDEKDTLARVATFASEHTLRKLYDASRASAVAKANEAKAEREKVKAENVATMSASLGEAAATLDDKAMSRLAQSVGAFMSAANKGDANARAVLAALAASILEARAAWEAPAQAEPLAEAA